MNAIRAVKNSLRLFRQHPIVAALGFILGVTSWLLTSAHWPKQYTGTALIAWNGQPSPISRLGEGPRYEARRAALTALLRDVTARLDWSEILRRCGCDPGGPGISERAAALASQASIQQISSPNLGGDGVRIVYTAGDRDNVIQVIHAVADGLTRPSGHDVPRLAATSLAPSSVPPLYAPVDLPTVNTDQEKPLFEKHRRHSPHKRLAHLGAMSPKKKHAKASERAQSQEEPLQTVASNGFVDQPSAAPDNATALASPLLSLSASPSLQRERLRQDFERLERELADLRDRYSSPHPDLAANREKLRYLQVDLVGVAASTSISGGTHAKVLPATESDADAGAIPASYTQSSEAAGESTREAAAGPGSTLTANVPQSAFFLARVPTISTRPQIFAAALLWPLCFTFGFTVAMLAAWLAERQQPSIRNEGMLLRELPASAVYLGGIPTIRHEVVAE